MASVWHFLESHPVCEEPSLLGSSLNSPEPSWFLKFLTRHPKRTFLGCVLRNVCRHCCTPSFHRPGCSCSWSLFLLSSQVLKSYFLLSSS